jgi:TPR repeat protein
MASDHEKEELSPWFNNPTDWPCLGKQKTVDTPQRQQEAATTLILRGPASLCTQGLCVMAGREGPVDYPRGLRLLRQAAAQGSVQAQLNLGRCHEEGRGVPRDLAAAMHAYVLAAVRGDALAQFHLGRLVERGEGGVPLDADVALLLFWTAAMAGYAPAQVRLSQWRAAKLVDRERCEAPGLCAALSNAHTARYWLRKAADQGYPPALLMTDARYNKNLVWAT